MKINDNVNHNDLDKVYDHDQYNLLFVWMNAILRNFDRKVPKLADRILLFIRSFTLIEFFKFKDRILSVMLEFFTSDALNDRLSEDQIFWKIFDKILTKILIAEMRKDAYRTRFFESVKFDYDSLTSGDYDNPIII